MEKVILGKTGLHVKRLGFGGIPIRRVSESQAVEVVRHAVNKGVDFIDTARGYTTSEHRIGLALKHTDKRVVLASKSTGKTAKDIREDLEASLKNLQKDYIDLYQCHFVRNNDEYEQILSSGGALEGLKIAKEEGLIGHIGITSHSLDLLDRVLDDGLFETIMLCFSFLENAAQKKIIPKAFEKEVGVIVMKPFSGGIIDNAKLALKYVLSQPGILIIPGVEQREAFDENWSVFRGSHALKDSEKAEIEEISKQFDRVFCRRCDYCQPCTEDIPIQSMLGIRYLIKRVGEAILEKESIKDGIEKARECSECGECMSRCPYELPIPDLIKENLKWLDENMR